MSALAYRILFHVLALGVFAVYLVNLRRQLKAGTPLSELKTYVFGLVISGALAIFTLITVIFTAMPRSF